MSLFFFSPFFYLFFSSTTPTPPGPQTSDGFCGASDGMQCVRRRLVPTDRCYLILTSPPGLSSRWMKSRRRERRISPVSMQVLEAGLIDCKLSCRAVCQTTQLSSVSRLPSMHACPLGNQRACGGVVRSEQRVICRHWCLCLLPQDGTQECSVLLWSRHSGSPCEEEQSFMDRFSIFMKRTGTQCNC